jgi:MFS family permease
MLTLLRAKRARRFFLAHLQSQLGTGAAYVALVLIAYQRLHRSWAIALVLIADVLPGIVLSAPFGALADRLPRTRLAVTAELLRSAAFIALATVRSFPATVALALAAGVGTALFRPAVGAALPQLVPERQRSAATALYGAIVSLGLTAGPALTALALLVSTPQLVLAANGVTFLLSAILLSRVPLSSDEAALADQGDEAVDGVIPGPVGRPIPTRQVGIVLLIGAASVFAGALMNVAEPLLATGLLHAGNAGYSLLIAVYGAGMVAGSLLCARASGDVRRLWWLLLAAHALCGAGMIGSAAAPNLAWATCTFAMTGVANALIVSLELRLLQEFVPGQMLGRVFGVQNTLQNAALLAAFLSAGLLLSPLGTRSTFALGGTALLALTALAAAAFAPRPLTATNDLPRLPPGVSRVAGQGLGSDAHGR